jgi:Protein of unknown function (DUF3040)
VDDDPVLRALGADLERDDPSLAALLSGSRRPHSAHRVVRFLLVLSLALGPLTAALVLPITVALGACVMLLIGASPFAAAWLCTTADEVRPKRPA